MMQVYEGRLVPNLVLCLGQVIFATKCDFTLRNILNHTSRLTLANFGVPVQIWGVNITLDLKGQIHPIEKMIFILWNWRVVFILTTWGVNFSVLQPEGWTSPPKACFEGWKSLFKWKFCHVSVWSWIHLVMGIEWCQGLIQDASAKSQARCVCVLHSMADNHVGTAWSLVPPRRSSCLDDSASLTPLLTMQWMKG